MITVYYRKTCTSSKRAFEWLTEQKLDFQAKDISQIPVYEIYRLLPLTDGGMESIVKSQIKGSVETQRKLEILQNLSFNEGILYLKKHPELLQTPLVIEGEKYLVGFNNEEIRKFIPRSMRRLQFL